MGIAMKGFSSKVARKLKTQMQECESAPVTCQRITFAAAQQPLLENSRTPYDSNIKKVMSDTSIPGDTSPTLRRRLTLQRGKALHTASHAKDPCAGWSILGLPSRQRHSSEAVMDQETMQAIAVGGSLPVAGIVMGLFCLL